MPRGDEPFCPKGHPLEGDNLYLHPGGYRRCRACHNEIETKRRQRLIAQRPPRPPQGMTPERFWTRVDTSNPDGCWEWTGNRSGGTRTAPYGRFQRTVNGKLQIVRAHRYAYEITYGPIPDGLRVLHRCDNPPCCRPDHLFLGTDLDNALDKKAKGRARNQHTALRAAGDPNARSLAQLVELYHEALTTTTAGDPAPHDPPHCSLCADVSTAERAAAATEQEDSDA